MQPGEVAGTRVPARSEGVSNGQDFRLARKSPPNSVFHDSRDEAWLVLAVKIQLEYEANHHEPFFSASLRITPMASNSIRNIT